MPDGNGKNRFWIEVKCENEVYDEEWAAILLLVNMLLQKHDNGRFANVGAYLCEDESNKEITW